MGERDLLLEEIYVNPEDETVKLAYADWLDEHDPALDPGRADLIKLQIQRKRSASPVSDEELSLISKHRDRWLEIECPECEGEGGFKRKDVIEWVECDRCEGTGDVSLLTLVVPVDHEGTEQRHSYDTEFRDGFPYRVTCDRIDSLFEDAECETCGSSGQVPAEFTGVYNCPECSGQYGLSGLLELEPTDLLLTWMQHRTIQEVISLDRQPEVSGSMTLFPFYGWTSGIVWLSSNVLPDDVLALCDKRYDTHQQAITAAGKAIVSVARRVLT